LRPLVAGGIVHRVVVAITVFGIAFTALAHREPGSLTSIDWNDITRKTEIIHRLHSHDAELGIGDVLNMPDLSVLDLEGRAHIALYVEERFHIEDSEGELKLELIGAELVGNHILVFQERSGRLPERIRIQDNILQDAYPAQINQVNIEDGEAIHSLIFTSDDDWQVYEFLQ